MRILWQSNAGWVPSGYGVQSKLFCSRIKKLGHEIACAPSWGLHGGQLVDADGILNYPCLRHAYGQDIVGNHARHFQADIIITLMDSWVMEPENYQGIPWVPWYPVDHNPLPPLIANKIREQAFFPITYSKFGVEMSRAEGIDVAYVPHGVDLTAYAPMDQAEARARLNWPKDAFIVGCVAANTGNAPSRKAWPEMLLAFARLAKQNKDARLYCHTVTSTENAGVNIMEAVHLAAQRVGVPDLTNRVMFIDQYMNRIGLPEDYMRSVYSAFDVFLNPSMGEGFGVPILEAQACGCPAIIGNWTSMPEILFAGWAVQKCTPMYTGLASYQFMPDVDGIVECLGFAYEARGDKELRATAAAGAAQYDADYVTRAYWKPVLDQVAERLAYSKLLRHKIDQQNAMEPQVLVAKADADTQKEAAK